MAQALVVGLVIGGIYSLFALGIVLIYTGSGVLNFAQAEIGTFTLFIAQILIVEHHLPYAVGALVAIALALVIGVTFERLAVWPLLSAPRVTVAVATLALLALGVALEITLFGPVGRNLDPPVAGHSVNVIGVFVSPTQIASLILVALVAGALAAFFRYTDFGLSVVAAAQDQEALRFLGIPLARASMFTWGLAAVLSAVAALLIQPSIGVISPSAYSGIFIRALSAALIGGLSSMRGAFVGGVVVGVGEGAIRHLTVGSSITGLPELCIFAAVVVTLVFRPQGMFGVR
ncbi:MAG: branched-chain amino acid transport system permease protein [Mycobacterium sp.]|nr:branched-chain amino acid transport system permease protein [Mycobacterium sp.]MDT7549142.1 branched-chain amino acid transport system permease protein [Actinomycetota bacterium]